MGTKRRPLRRAASRGLRPKPLRRGKVATSAPWRARWGSTFGASRRRCRPRSSRAACRLTCRPFPIVPLLGRGYPKVLELQRQLLEVAGWPQCREAYERNLAEAVECAEYRALLVRDPDARHQGTGMDPASLRERLKEAREEVAYRKKLLADLDAKETPHGEASGPFHRRDSSGTVKGRSGRLSTTI